MPKSRKGGVLLPTVSKDVSIPVKAYDLAQLDDRQNRGYVMYQKICEGGKYSKIRLTLSAESSDTESVVYAPTKEYGSSYIVRRSVVNAGGTMVVKYACTCLDFDKNFRSGCKHTFCETLYRTEAKTYGEPPAREPRRNAERRCPRNRRGANGMAMRTNQRHARREMPVRIPEMIDTMRRAEDRRVHEALASIKAHESTDRRRRGGQMTTDSTRCATLILKVSNGLSSDAMYDRYRTYIDRKLLALREPPHPNTVSMWMNDAALEPVLNCLFHEGVRIHRAQETVGIIDSTKLSDAETTTYRGKEYRGDDRPDARWMKCHVLAGLETNAVLAYEFSSDARHDSLYYESLVKTAMKTFPLEYVLADRAYLSEQILGWSMEEFGIKAVIPIKKRWSADTKSRYYDVCAEAVDLYDNRRKSFDEMYRFRAKVEAVFSVIKRMFCGYVWSKGRRNSGADDDLSQAWRNETICKLIAYNLRCSVIQEIHTGIKADFLVPNRFFPSIPMELRAMQIAS